MTEGVRPATRGPRDQDLVDETLRGSREAYGLLVVRHSRTVRALCLARLGTRRELDDIVQEAFLRAFRGLPRLKARDRFAAYLHRIARNICADLLRRRNPDTLSTDEVQLESPGGRESTADLRQERLSLLRELVGRLPLALREAVLMFYFEGQSYEQIAALLGVTEAAVNQRLHRARVSLRRSFGLGRAVGQGRGQGQEEGQ